MVDAAAYDQATSSTSRSSDTSRTTTPQPPMQTTVCSSMKRRGVRVSRTAKQTWLATKNSACPTRPVASAKSADAVIAIPDPVDMAPADTTRTTCCGHQGAADGGRHDHHEHQAQPLAVTCRNRSSRPPWERLARRGSTASPTGVATRAMGRK